MNELAITLDMKSGVYLYEQIYQYIKNEIVEGKLSEQERLPSTRALAEHLQIARSTVELAYEQLVSEGYIEAKPYKGYFVCAVGELYHLKKEKVIRGEEQRKEAAYLFDLSPNGIEMKAFPFPTWRRISKNVLAEHQREIFEAGHPQGDFAFRNTICRYLYSFRGVNCEPEQIVVGAGNDYLLLLLGKILGEHQRVAMETPTYQRAYQIFCSAGYEMLTLPIDKNGMSMEHLKESGANIAYVMPSHQFPTGVVMPIGRRMELLKWAEEAEDRYLIEDDYDSEFRYKGKPIQALQAWDKKEKVIYVGTFSKSIAPAIRVSFMVLPRPLLRLYEKNVSFLSSTVSRIDQAILNEFIGGGHYERYLNKMRKIYRSKHDCLLECLKPFKNKFRISGENAGLHIVLISKEEGIHEEWLTKTAREVGIKVYGMSDYFIQGTKGIGKEKQWRIGEDLEEKHAKVLLGYASLSEEEIRKALFLLQKAWL
ncbi:MAG: PLP-dependent aminotransferase family protein [Lachnospiraceae bacterium]|nr:PLP-dependent aminotransferase family protein [Lachnospiraceae bacterium]